MALSLERLIEEQSGNGSTKAIEQPPVRRLLHTPQSLAPTCQQMLDEFPYKNVYGRGVIEKFETEKGRHVYNTTGRFKAPFEGRVGMYILGRDEPDDNENSRTRLFTRTANGLAVVKNGPVFDGMQDPNFVLVDGHLVIIGVKTGINPSTGRRTYWTDVYLGDDLDDFKEAKPFFTTPYQIKDFRFVPREKEDDPIGIIPRFQRLVVGEADGRKEVVDGGLGLMGYNEIGSLNELNLKTVMEATIIEGLFAPGEWGGPNWARRAKKGKKGDINIVGHHARHSFSQAGKEIKDYYATAWIINSHTRSLRVRPWMIAWRNNFVKTPAKPLECDVSNVVFPSDIEPVEDNIADLWAGLSDARQGRLRMIDPFWRVAIDRAA